MESSYLALKKIQGMVESAKIESWILVKEDERYLATMLGQLRRSIELAWLICCARKQLVDAIVIENRLDEKLFSGAKGR